MDRIAFFNGNQAYIFDRDKYNQYLEKNSVYTTRFVSQQMLIDKLQQRIDKAIEYVEEHRIKNPYHYEYNCFMGNARTSDLLEILKGDSK